RTTAAARPRWLTIALSRPSRLASQPGCPAVVPEIMLLSACGARTASCKGQKGQTAPRRQPGQPGSRRPGDPGCVQLSAGATPTRLSRVAPEPQCHVVRCDWL